MRAVVAGGGVMGCGIAAALARAQYDIDLVDVDLPTARGAVGGISAILEESVRRGKLIESEAQAAIARITPSGSVRDAGVMPDLAIEAVPESPKLKQEVLSALEQLRPALLATNTSALSVDALADALARPEAFIGLHFFNPVPAMRLVEVVVGTLTSPATTNRALSVVAAVGKEAVIVRDTPGFATSRLGVALGLEAIRMVEQGVAGVSDIDRAMVLGYAHPIGPLRLTDLVGLDVRLAIARNLAGEYGQRFDPPDLLVSMVADGRLGKKSGSGFYEWPDPDAH